MPYWDFSKTNEPDEPRDASAACILASALMELIQLLEPASEDKVFFTQKVTQILYSLGNNYLNDDPKFPYLINHCTGNRPHNSEVDVPLIYADYYFMEAIFRWKQWKNDQSIRPRVDKD